MTFSIPNPIKFSLFFALASLFSGCGFLSTDVTCSGHSQSVTLSKVLTPTDRYFLLSTTTAAADLAILSEACPVTFSLTYRWNDTGFAAANSANALSLPLNGLSTHSIFHVDYDNVNFAEYWQIHTERLGAPTLAGPDNSYVLSVTDHGNYNGNTRGVFYIKTNLFSSVTSADSSVFVSGSIEYFSDTP